MIHNPVLPTRPEMMDHDEEDPRCLAHHIMRPKSALPYPHKRSLSMIKQLEDGDRNLVNELFKIDSGQDLSISTS